MKNLSPELRERVRKNPLLRVLDDTQITAVMERAQCYSLAEGEYLFRQGDPVKQIFIAAEGFVKLFRLTPGGDEKVVDIIKAGDSFAEAAAFRAMPRYPVHATALKPACIIGIDIAHYLELLRQSPELCFNLMGVMSQRMHWLLNEVDRLTLHNATFRLAAYLLDLQAGNDGDPLIHFDVPKHVIASRLSVKPETLSRILKQLSERALIKVRENNIELLDPDALLEMTRIE